MERFEAAIEAFDAANAEDPQREIADGASLPRALAYAHRMTKWLERIAPDASEVVKLAARAQHIRRWTKPRAEYPMDRAGYYRWRTALGRFHAETAGALLRDVGYDAETIGRVQSLLRKERLKMDSETQLLEDVICLVFLENYFADFAAQHEPDKVIDIVRKTWTKMSPRGHAEALKIPLSPDAATLVGAALSGSDAPAE